MEIKELKSKINKMNAELADPFIFTMEVKELRLKMIKVYTSIELMKEDMELQDLFLDWNVEEVKNGEGYADADTMVEDCLNNPQLYLNKILGFMYSDSHNYIWNDIKQNWEKEVGK